MADQAKWLSRQVDRLYRTRPDYRVALDFYIFFQKNAEVELESVVLPDFWEDAAEDRLALGLPLFEIAELPIDIEAAGRFIGRLAQADFPVMENILAVVDKFRDRPDDLAWLCRVLTAGDGEGLAAWSRARGLDKDLVAIVTRWALMPSFLKLRQAAAGHIEGVDWRERVCPICGSGPFMARLEKDGGRTLACRLCGQEWQFPRLKCPFCETEDRSVLSYLSAGDGSGYRIDVCGLCRRYLKVVDSREQEDVLPLELEDLLTQHLDLVARHRGYTAP